MHQTSDMAQQQVNVTNLFVDLQRLGASGEYERALKICNKILQEVPDDVKAFHCKIVCFIQMGKFDDGLTAVHKNSALSSDMVFEKAYCEYRLNRTKEALKTLRSQENPDERCQELLGQVLYRMEEYDECFGIYKQLMKNSQDDFEEERETNLSAVMAALQTWGDVNVDEYGLREDTYELCYNSACFLLGKDMYQEAYDKLMKAEELCRATFADDPDATVEEIEGELGIIKVQMGFCMQKMGKSSEANKLYNQVLKMRPSDITVTAVASNNIVTINKEQNIFDSKKKMKSATIHALQQKLISQQKEAIAVNQCLLLMYANQGDDCKRMARQLAKEYPDNVKPALIEAAQFCRDKQVPKAIDALKSQIEKQPGNPISLKLTLAQLYLGQGQVYKACDVLRDLDEYSYKPGVVSALVTLYLSQEDADSASDVLNSAVQWYTEHRPASEELVNMIRANANFQLRHGSPQTATEMLEQLHKRNPKDVKTLAQLISAYSKFDAKKAQAVSKQLPSPETVAQAVDVEALEASVTVLGPKYIKKATKTDPASPGKPQSPSSGNLLEKKRNKKKKKGKLPKDVTTPGGDMDQERWLPMRERSYYRGKKRKNLKKEVGKGTQGGVNLQQMQQLDASRPTASAAAAAPSPSSSDVGSPRPGSATTSQTPDTSSGPRKQKPQANKQKKKKKGGGKW